MYSSYVKALPQEKKISKLVFIPIGIALLIYLAPSLLQMAFGLVFPAPLTQIGSLPAALSMIATVMLSLWFLPKFNGVDRKYLGLLGEGMGQTESHRWTWRLGFVELCGSGYLAFGWGNNQPK